MRTIIAKITLRLLTTIHKVYQAHFTNFTMVANAFGPESRFWFRYLKMGVL